jgi:hypothetical protein
MSFLSTTFLFALFAGGGPILIHLLNRRRHRTVQWAAMNFLREAVRRNRRVMEIRDLLLLLLRTMAVVLFILAMAQPYFESEQGFWIFVGAMALAVAAMGAMILGKQRESMPVTAMGGVLLLACAALVAWSFSRPMEKTERAFAGKDPIHAIIVVDNSLSMGFVPLGQRSLLEVAKDKARDFVNRLPRGSEMSIIPMCRQGTQLSGVSSTTDDALGTLDQIEVVDQRARAGEVIDAAIEAKSASRLPTKRVVFISDMQKQTWSDPNAAAALAKLEDVQIVSVGPARRENIWVSDFRLREGLADARSAAIFDVVVSYQGDKPRRGVRVRLKVRDEVVREQTIDLEGGTTVQQRKLLFRYRFDLAGSSKEPLYTPVRLEVDGSDSLELDDQRTVIVPVVAAVPVLFIDDLGESEQPQRMRYGATYNLRGLLAPDVARDDGDKHLIEIRHRSGDQLTADELKDARLVVVAGIESPNANMVRLLREYVDQGGQLFLAAGGQFNPRLWNAAAWQDGAGILPAPLKLDAVGRVPTATTGTDYEWDTFKLAENTFQGETIDLRLSERQRKDVISLAFFFKAVAVDTQAMDKIVDLEKGRIQEYRDALAVFNESEKKLAGRTLTEQEEDQRETARLKLQESFPRWLEWGFDPMAPDPTSMTPMQLARQSKPRILANYDNGEAFVVEREFGSGGRIVMVTTGCLAAGRIGWSTLTSKGDAGGNQVIILDRILRSLLGRSLPVRTLEATREISIPVTGRDQAAAFSLYRPGEKQAQLLRPGAVGSNRYALKLRSVGKRGVYKIERLESDGSSSSASGARKVWPMLLAINGPSVESQLDVWDESEFRTYVDSANVRWVGSGETISLSGKAFISHDAWKLLMLVALICLLAEMLFVILTRGLGSPIAPAEAKI